MTGYRLTLRAFCKNRFIGNPRTENKQGIQLDVTSEINQMTMIVLLPDRRYLLQFYCPTGFLPRETRPGVSQLRRSRATQPTVHAGYFSVSIIQRILTWNVRTDVNACNSGEENSPRRSCRDSKTRPFD